MGLGWFGFLISGGYLLFDAFLKLQRIFSNHAPRFYSKGYPKLKLNFTHNTSRTYIQLNFEQTQCSNDIPVLAFTLPVFITTTSGKVYTTEAVFSDNSTKATSVVKIGDGEKVKILELDPEMKVLFECEGSGVGEDVLEGTARAARDVRGRVWAYRELVRGGSYSALRRVS